ncbi:MAG TPA: ankyrin repeat domain-containing protein [Solirubrobacteraceae bacterium]
MNLGQLRKQAKELVRAARSGDPDALRRLGDLPARLASAQLVLAREQGYTSWPALVHALEADVESFVMAATSGRCQRARHLLDARPEIASDPWARLVLGRGWDRNVSASGGPRGWAPLLYVTFSCFASLELARQLLADGADPTVTFHNEYGDMPALYGAAGVVHDPELTELLLEAGANPNDGESLYHSMEADDPACLRVLLEHGADPRGTAALPHAIDYDKLEHVRLLLEAGADPNEGHWALLVHAVRRGCGPEMVRLLADHGAQLDRRGGEWSTPPEEYRTAYQNAVLRGHDDLAGLLAELGASTDVAPEDLTVAGLARGERPAEALPPKLSPDAEEALILAALRGRLELIVEVVGPNFFGHSGGGPPGMLLHHACWIGNPEVVGRLLELGADPTASGEEYGPPAVWAALGSQEGHALPGRDYITVVEQLVAAGAKLENRLIEMADGPLADWLEDHVGAA